MPQTNRFKHSFTIREYNASRKVKTKWLLKLKRRGRCHFLEMKEGRLHRSSFSTGLFFRTGGKWKAQSPVIFFSFLPNCSNPGIFGTGIFLCFVTTRLFSHLFLSRPLLEQTSFNPSVALNCMLCKYSWVSNSMLTGDS